MKHLLTFFVSLLLITGCNVNQNQKDANEAKDSIPEVPSYGYCERTSYELWTKKQSNNEMDYFCIDESNYRNGIKTYTLRLNARWEYSDVPSARARIIIYNI